MSTALLRSLETAIERLTQTNSDGNRERNDIGWNMADAGLGRNLYHSVGRWGEGQVKLAWKMVQKYRRTQLSDLSIPAFVDDAGTAAAVSNAVRSRLQEAMTLALNTPGFGLEWGDPRRVKTVRGPRMVQSATVPRGHIFFELRKYHRPELDAAGIQLSQFNGAWVANVWLVLEEVAPTILTTQTYQVITLTDSRPLWDWQVASAERVVASMRAFGSSLDASDLGTGKTFVALVAARNLCLTPVVVCGLAAVPDWEAAAKVVGITITVLGWEKLKAGKTPIGTWTGPQKTTFVWDPKIAAGGIIFDEIHRAKSHSSKNALMVIAATAAGYPRMGLSASVALCALDLKAVGYMIGLHQLKGFWQWTEQYGCRRSRWGGYEFNGRASDTARLHAEIFPTHGTRIRKADLGDKFPETSISFTLVPVNNARELSAAWADVAAAEERVHQRQAEAIGLLGGDDELAITKRLRARQLSELGKVPAILDLADEMLEEGVSPVVFVNFRDTFDLVVGALEKAGHAVTKIYGNQDPDERRLGIELFQANKHRVAVATTAGSESISLHDLHGGFPRGTLISPNDDARKLIQITGRVCRGGGKSKSTQRILLAAGTVEEDVAENGLEKLANLDALNDNDLSPIRAKITGETRAS